MIQDQLSTRRLLHFALVIACLAPLGLSARASADDSGESDNAKSTTHSDRKPTLYIIGDSTVHNHNLDQVGWGDVIAQHFDTDRINVVNRARGGRSSRTYRHEGLWDDVLAESHPGDYVLIQFGHNDPGSIAGRKFRGSIRGLGDKTQNVTHPNGSKEVVHTFGWYMSHYITEARQHGLTPIVCSYIPRCPRDPAVQDIPVKPAGPPQSYALYARQVAQKHDAYFIPLYRLVWEEFVGMKPKNIKAKYYSEHDHTHTNRQGALLSAASVVQGLREIEGLELKNYLKPKR